MRRWNRGCGINANATRQSFDDAERHELFAALQRRLHELEPLSALFYFRTPVLHDKRLAGVVSSPIGYMRTTAGPRLWRWSGS